LFMMQLAASCFSHFTMRIEMSPGLHFEKVSAVLFSNHPRAVAVIH
jgi:hypothetical protein